MYINEYGILGVNVTDMCNSAPGVVETMVVVSMQHDDH